MDKLEFVLTDDIGISSRYRAFPDGSELVEIYEGLVATMDLLSRPFAESLSRMTRSPVAMLRGARAVQRGENVDEVDLAVRLVLIRYAMIHRMVLGTVGSLDYRLDERGRSMLDVLHHCGIEFALAHEVAHHLLGHTARPRGDAVVADGAACTDDSEREFAADALAYEITSRSAAGPLMSAIGAYFVFSATDYSARALFVRTGITHPPSADRRSRILRQMAGRQRQAFGALTAHIEAAIDIALDLRSAVSTSYWRTAYEAPAVCTEPHSERYFASLCSLDQILCAPLERCEWMLGHFDGRFGTRLASALPAIREHRPGDALRAWGLTESRVAELLNPQLALTFDGLRTAIHTKLSNPAYTSADRRVLALTMARLVAPTLNRKT